jgi:hypothetical protein
LIATLHFDSTRAIKEAFASECVKACAADRRVLAPVEVRVEIEIERTPEVNGTR